LLSAKELIFLSSHSGQEREAFVLEVRIEAEGFIQPPRPHHDEKLDPAPE
jgi:hypothetical protein